MRGERDNQLRAPDRILIKNLALASWNTAVSFGPTEGQITDSVLDDGSNLPRYYFGDLPAEVMQEIMDEMASSKPVQDIEEVDHWLIRAKHAQVNPQE